VKNPTEWAGDWRCAGATFWVFCQSKQTEKKAPAGFEPKTSSP